MTSKTGLKRDVLDKFYTKQSAVKECFVYINQYLDISDSDLVIEPSAGNGAFIKDIKKISRNYKFYDIDPYYYKQINNKKLKIKHSEVVQKDYLSLQLDDELNSYDNIHIIGNPPFGRQSSMLIKFIKHSSLILNVKSISFILPKSFKKDSLKKHIPLNYHLLHQHDLKENSFTIDNNEYNVPCIFQIWEKKNYDRVVPVKLFPDKFKFVKKNESPHMSFRRVGVNAGTLSFTDLESKSSESHYFIRFNNSIDTISSLKLKLKNICFNHDNTVGPKSISKQEIIEIFNNVL